MAPFSATIRATVDDLGPGHARIVMRERRALQNHLGSVHAIALMNLAEVTGGLALNYALSPDARAILTALSIEYLKKARGRLTAEASIEPPATTERQEYEYETVIRDANGDVVARAVARWLVGPKE